MSGETDFHSLDRRQPLPCQDHEKRLSLIEQSGANTQRTMEAVSTKLDLILAQITKIALLEQKHDTAAIDISRAHGKVEKLTEEVEALAKETRAFINYSAGRDKVLWAIGGIVMALVIKALFFASSHGMTP